MTISAAGGDLRVISLIASVTEIVCALGLEAALVGRSHECDYPAGGLRQPACTDPKFDPSGRSYAIDQRVKAIVQEALGDYWVDAGRLEALQPTHIITQTQCSVCAVDLVTVEAAVCQLIESRPVIVALEPNALADVWRDMRRVGAALALIDDEDDPAVAAQNGRPVTDVGQDRRVAGVRREGRVVEEPAGDTLAHCAWVRLSAISSAATWASAYLLAAIMPVAGQPRQTAHRRNAQASRSSDQCHLLLDLLIQCSLSWHGPPLPAACLNPNSRRRRRPCQFLCPSRLWPTSPQLSAYELG